MVWQEITPTLISAVISSAVVSAVVAGWVSRRNAERTIQVENITQERAKWRHRLRKKTAEIHTAFEADPKDIASLKSIHSQLSVNLNPFDDEDAKILKLLAILCEDDSNETVVQELIIRISLLLKHDWERAKHEVRGQCWRSPQRITYEKFRLSEFETSVAKSLWFPCLARCNK